MNASKTIKAGSAGRAVVAGMLLGVVVVTAGCGGGGKSGGSGASGGNALITESVRTIVGTGDSGYNGDGRLPKDTELYWPQDTYVDASGHLWILDWNNHRVRRADTLNSPVSTVIGSGFIGDTRTGPADQADLNHPTSITSDPQGRMILAAWHNWTVKRLDPNGDIEAIVGSAFGPQTGGDGGPATQASLNLGSSAEYDAAGNLYISEEGARRIRKVDAVTGIITTFAGQAGKTGFAGDGGPATQALFNTPTGSDAVPCFKLAIDGQQLYVADTLNNRIRVIDLGSGIINTFAGTGDAAYGGDGGPATHAQLNNPTDVTIGPDHSVYIADARNNVVRRVRPDGTISTVAGNGTAGFSGDGGDPTKAEFNDPAGVFVDRNGVLYIADTLNQRIRAFKLPA